MSQQQGDWSAPAISMPNHAESKKVQLTPALMRAMQQMPGNNVCADCETPAPDWASVNHGCMVCLNCSGTHRAIGVHLSFVRSVYMDKWAAEEIDLMLCAGNKVMNKFLGKNGMSKNDIKPGYSGANCSLTKTKYDSSQAKKWRAKLLKVCKYVLLSRVRV